MFFRSWCSFQSIPSLELFQRAAKSGASTAIISNGSKFSYRQLLHDSHKLSERLRLSVGSMSSADLQERRVAFLCPSTYEYVATQWAIWSAGGVAVPLTSHHPPAELEYYIRDSQASIVVGHHSSSKVLQSIAEKCGAVYLEISDIATSQVLACILFL
jgi:malonyl-CoA/methylmalonyl-CoA synthetase